MSDVDKAIDFSHECFSPGILAKMFFVLVWFYIWHFVRLGYKAYTQQDTGRTQSFYLIEKESIEPLPLQLSLTIMISGEIAQPMNDCDNLQVQEAFIVVKLRSTPLKLEY